MKYLVLMLIDDEHAKQPGDRDYTADEVLAALTEDEARSEEEGVSYRVYTVDAQGVWNESGNYWPPDAERLAT